MTGGGGGILAEPKFCGGKTTIIVLFIRLLNKILLQFCKEFPTESVIGENVVMPALVSSDLLTEWKAFQTRELISKNKN